MTNEEWNARFDAMMAQAVRMDKEIDALLNKTRVLSVAVNGLINACNN